MKSERAPVLCMELICLPSLAWFWWFSRFPSVAIERFSRFEKGSFRNRWMLPTRDGLRIMTIPVVGGRNQRKPYPEIRIAMTGSWQRDHWHGIQSIYGRAPFFEEVADEIKQWWLQPETDILWDWNLNRLKNICGWLSLKEQIIFTQIYEPDLDPSFIDVRLVSAHPAFDGSGLIPYHPWHLNPQAFNTDVCILDAWMMLGPSLLNHLAQGSLPAYPSNARLP